MPFPPQTDVRSHPRKDQQVEWIEFALPASPRTPHFSLLTIECSVYAQRLHPQGRLSHPSSLHTSNELTVLRRGICWYISTSCRAVPLASWITHYQFPYAGIISIVSALGVCVGNYIKSFICQDTRCVTIWQCTACMGGMWGIAATWAIHAKALATSGIVLHHLLTGPLAKVIYPNVKDVSRRCSIQPHRLAHCWHAVRSFGVSDYYSNRARVIVLAIYITTAWIIHVSLSGIM